MGYTIVAHENVRARLNSIQYHLFFKTGTRPRPPDALPVITYDDRMTFHLNDEVIEVIHVPVAHTDGDSAFYFREANVLHTGDAFINRGYPLIDIASGGSIKGVIEAANQMLEIVDDETIIIPGHGPLADRARMIEIRDMLADARERVVALIDQGMSLNDIKAAKPLATLDPEWGQGLVKGRAFVTIIYQSETGDWEIPREITRWNQ
jgi:glyoxylase-like metal-dependent hydrolase (beta-lactamase superfamily II)